MSFTTIYLAIGVLMLAFFAFAIKVNASVSEMAEMGIRDVLIVMLLSLLWPISIVLIKYSDTFSAWVDSLPDKNSKKDR